MKLNLNYVLSDVADEQVRAGILATLVIHNESQVGPSGQRPLVIALHDDDGKVVGGLWGWTGYQWLFTQLLSVPAAARHQGVGTELLRRAEVEALARGCHSAWLDTFDFQAKPFYEKLGYECFAELEDYPPGHRRYFLRKRLVSVARESA